MPKKYRSPVLDRRSFVKIVTASLGSIMAAVVGLPAIQYFISPAIGRGEKDQWISLGSLDNYPPNIPTLFNFTITTVNGWERSSMSYGAFVYHEDGKEPVVYSDVCTHLSCRVNWNEERGEFDCPCHAAYFDVHGEVISGPPPRPLDKYEIKIEDNQLFIYLTDG